MKPIGLQKVSITMIRKDILCQRTTSVIIHCSAHEWSPCRNIVTASVQWKTTLNMLWSNFIKTDATKTVSLEMITQAFFWDTDIIQIHQNNWISFIVAISFNATILFLAQFQPVFKWSRCLTGHSLNTSFSASPPPQFDDGISQFRSQHDLSPTPRPI